MQIEHADIPSLLLLTCCRDVCDPTEWMIKQPLVSATNQSPELKDRIVFYCALEGSEAFVQAVKFWHQSAQLALHRMEPSHQNALHQTFGVVVGTRVIGRPRAGAYGAQGIRYSHVAEWIYIQ